MGLTAKEVKSLKPKGKRYEVLDGNGLYLYIATSGVKTWYYVYYVDGKRRQKKIGVYPTYSLHEAREIHKQLVEQRERGELDAPRTLFRDVAEKAIASFEYRDGGKEARRSLSRDVFPFIGDIPIDSLRRVHIADMLDHKRDTPRQYNTTKSRVSRVCTYACQRGWIELNPCANLPKAQENPPEETVLTSEEIREIVDMRKTSGAARVLFFMLLTGQRPGECRDVQHADISGRWWTCKQYKGGRVSEKRIYLTDEALEHVGSGSGRVFDFKVKAGLAKYCKRRKRRYIPRDIRRTCATLLAREGFDDYLIHRFLGHSVDKLTQTYNRHKYDPQLQEMAEVLRDAVLKNPPAEGGATGGNVKGP